MISQCDGVKIISNNPKHIAQKWEEKAKNEPDENQRERFLQQAEHWNREERQMDQRGNFTASQNGQSRSHRRRDRRRTQAQARLGNLSNVWPAGEIKAAQENQHGAATNGAEPSGA